MSKDSVMTLFLIVLLAISACDQNKGKYKATVCFDDSAPVGHRMWAVNSDGSCHEEDRL